MRVFCKMTAKSTTATFPITLTFYLSKSQISAFLPVFRIRIHRIHSFWASWIRIRTY
jgi:hypothetical protein